MNTELQWSVDRVDAAKMKTLALLLADPNPIHFDPAAVEKLGTGGLLINQGPSTIAMIYNLFATHRPGWRVKRLDVKLLGNVLEGDTVTVEARTNSKDSDVWDVEVRTAGGLKLKAAATLEPRT